MLFFLGSLRVKTQTGRAHHCWPHLWQEAWSPVSESRDMLPGWKCMKHIIFLAPRSHRHPLVGILPEHLLLFYLRCSLPPCWTVTLTKAAQQCLGLTCLGVNVTESLSSPFLIHGLALPPCFPGEPVSGLTHKAPPIICSRRQFQISPLFQK